MQKLPLMIGICVSCLSVSVQANSLNGASLIDKGMALAVTGNARISVPNDQAEMIWTVTEQAPTIKVATQKAIEAMNAGVAIIKEFGERVNLQTQSINTYPVYSETKGKEPSKIIAWRISQSVHVETQDITIVPEIISDMNGKLQLTNVSFSVSHQKQDGYQKQLIDQAVLDAMKKATYVAEAVGSEASKIQLQNLRFDGTSYPRPQYSVMRSSAKLNSADSMPIPAIEAGNSELSLSLTADVLIKK